MEPKNGPNIFCSYFAFILEDLVDDMKPGLDAGTEFYDFLLLWVIELSGYTFESAYLLGTLPYMESSVIMVAFIFLVFCGAADLSFIYD